MKRKGGNSVPSGRFRCDMTDAFGLKPVPFISTTPRSGIFSRDSVIFGEAAVQDRRRENVKIGTWMTLMKRYRNWGFVNVTEILLFLRRRLIPSYFERCDIRRNTGRAIDRPELMLADLQKPGLDEMGKLALGIGTHHDHREFSAVGPA